MNFEAIIFGKNGRFARSLISKIEDTKCFGYQDFMLEDPGRISRGIKSNNGFWTFGSGNKLDGDPQGELRALEKLLYLLQSNRIAMTNFVYLSSGGTIYGKQAGSASEKSPLHPTGLYAETKFRCEELITNEMLNYVESVQILRLANAYNLERTNNYPQGLVEKLYASALRGEPTQIYVDGNSRRQYGSHSDYSKVILNVSQVQLPYRSGRLEILNVYPPFNLSVNEIVMEMAQTLNLNPGILATFDYASNELDSLKLTSSQESRWQISSSWSSLSENILRAQS